MVYLKTLDKFRYKQHGNVRLWQCYNVTMWQCVMMQVFQVSDRHKWDIFADFYIYLFILDQLINYQFSENLFDLVKVTSMYL